MSNVSEGHIEKMAYKITGTIKEVWFDWILLESESKELIKVYFVRTPKQLKERVGTKITFGGLLDKEGDQLVLLASEASY